jgi:hypothetical protein
MKRFYALMRWLYPAAYIELDIHSGHKSPQYFVNAVRLLMNSGRQEGLLLAIQGVNEDRINFTQAIRNEPMLQPYPEAAKKPVKLCELVLASSKAAQILSESTLLIGSRIELTDVCRQLNAGSAAKGLSPLSNGRIYTYGFDLFIA